MFDVKINTFLDFCESNFVFLVRLIDLAVIVK